MQLLLLLRDYRPIISTSSSRAYVTMIAACIWSQLTLSSTYQHWKANDALCHALWVTRQQMVFAHETFVLLNQKYHFALILPSMHSMLRKLMVSTVTRTDVVRGGGYWDHPPSYVYINSCLAQGISVNEILRESNATFFSYSNYCNIRTGDAEEGKDKRNMAMLVPCSYVYRDLFRFPGSQADRTLLHIRIWWVQEPWMTLWGESRRPCFNSDSEVTYWPNKCRYIRGTSSNTCNVWGVTAAYTHILLFSWNHTVWYDGEDRGINFLRNVDMHVHKLHGKYQSWKPQNLHM
jgi:hypothetical protein